MRTIDYPFGMTMPGRSNGLGDYRFGYNGMEMDNEVSGNGNSYTTEFRQYDPRLMRWKSLDPLKKKLPMMSPYVALNNNPIIFIDLKGDIVEYAPGTSPEVKAKINELRVKSKTFAALYDALESSERTFLIGDEKFTGAYKGVVRPFGQMVDIDENDNFIYRDYTEIILTDAATDLTYYEEMFHALQDLVYGYPLNRAADVTNSPPDVFISRNTHEWEAEAKYARGVMAIEAEGRDQGVTQGGMIIVNNNVKSDDDFERYYNAMANNGSNEGMAFATWAFDNDYSTKSGNMQPYFNYLNNFEKLEKTSSGGNSPYKGNQRNLSPSAFQSIEQCDEGNAKIGPRREDGSF